MSDYRIHFYTECSCCQQARSRTEKFNHYYDAYCRAEEMVSNAITNEEVERAEIRLMEGQKIALVYQVNGERLFTSSDRELQ